MPYAKNHIRVKVPNRSGFDKSHRNSGTGLCGTLLPLLCDEVIPNTRVSLKINLATQLPPLVSNTYMNVKQKVEAFFVPGRLLCKSYEGWFCDAPVRAFYAANKTDAQDYGSFYSTAPAVPCVEINGGIAGTLCAPGTLADYLGIRNSGSDTRRYNLLPFIAYHLIWQEYYRNPRVQNPAFCPSIAITDDETPTAAPRIANVLDTFFRYSSTGLSASYLYTVTSSVLNDFKCADGVSIFDLRQRNFGLDYFTGARVSAQQGDSSAVTLSIPAGTDATGGTTNFTIAQLRAANSLQLFRERNNLPSSRLVDQVKARYGANLSDGVAQRPICIGSATYDYGSSGVSQTAPASSSPTSNPFDGIAAQYGRGYAAGSDFIIDDFVANEPGYIIVLQSMVPVVTYATGTPRMFTRYVGAGSIVEMANPLLQNVGDQEIFKEEVGLVNTGVFGYQDRYADFMYMPNQSHGLLRSGQSLQSFVLQRSLNNASFNTAFLEIPTTYLDGITQIASSTSGLSYWYDAMLEYKVSMPLAEWSIPSLQDPAYEHGSSVNLRRNGQIF